MKSDATREVRKAATVLVVRPGDAGIEVYMVQRPGRGAFPNLHVFPGGKVEGADAGLSDLCRGLSDAQASAELSVDGGGLRYWVAAIRECFEECGVLLAYRNGALFAPRGEAESARFDGYRNALAAGELELPALARREGLRLATDRVRYFSHWITPPSAPARFDTRFFITAMPPGQRAVGHHQEIISDSWITPARALANHEAGHWQMIHPTLTTLGVVARYGSVDDLMGAVAEGGHLEAVSDSLRGQGMQGGPGLPGGPDRPGRRRE